ncbi:MAG: inositol monophosphatase family protein [Deltaproteobacteria bacterium]|nr:inositol monophosphatase family protein [Deltaproteobacteria bacterium]
MTLLPTELDEALEAARAVAAEAGALLLEGLLRPKTVTFKGDVNLVTEYDRRAEDLITSRLGRLFPGFGILAEEGGVAGKADAHARWIIDPLDGTTNFSHGHPVFAVSIGLEDGGTPVAGVVAMPGLGVTVWARRGGGAFRNGEPVRVSNAAEIGVALVATGFPYDRRTARDDNTREYAAFVKRAQGVRRCGAAAVDLALTACGVYDGYWEPRLKPWDLAAGVVLVREAGGIATDYEGTEIDIHKGWILAAGPRLHQPMLEILRDARRFF